VVAEDRREPRQERQRADGPDDVERFRSRWQLTIAPRVQQCGNVDDVIGVEMCDGEMRDRLPLDADVGKTRRDPAPAIHEQSNVSRVDEMAALDATGPGCGCSGADGRE